MPKKDSFDVESHRNPYESNTEWRMRKQFLLAHHDKLDIDRLICLSNCYVNVEVYGCKYPNRVHAQLKELTKDFEIDNTGPITSRIKGVQKINFVKSSDSQSPLSADSEQPKSADTDKVITTDANETKMEPYNHAQDDNLRPNSCSSTNDPYSEFQRAMNDSGVSLSGDLPNPYTDQHHYEGSFQKYGEDQEVSQQVEEYLKQWAAYYESQHGQDPKIRYDYKAFQDQSDPDALTQSDSEAEVQSTLPAPTLPQQVQKKKISVVNPNFNFVKASTEFKSTELAEKKVEQPNNLMVPTVLAGKNRLGLGAASKKSGGNQSTATVTFIKGGKGTAFLETKFNNLCREVKSRYNPNKNAIEVLHQCVNKCKMQINDIYHTNERLPDGRVKYTMNLEINGVFVSSGGAPSKKVAKMEAYSKAVTLLTNPPVAIKEKTEDELYLVQKIEIGPTKPESTNTQSQVDSGIKKEPAQKTTEITKSNTFEKVKETYAKPKMVFHKAGEPVRAEEPPAPTAHPLSDKPLEFKKTETTSSSDVEASPNTEPNTVSKPFIPASQGPSRNEKFNHGRGHFSNRPGPPSFQRQTYHQNLGRFDRHGYDRPYYSYDQHGYGRQNYPYGRGYDDYSGYDDDDSERQDYPYDPRIGFERKSFLPAGSESYMYKRPGDRFDAPSPVKKVRKPGHVVLEDLSNFIIMDSSKISPNMNATTILHNSANFNRVILKYQFEEITGFGWRCKLLLSDEVVASSFGSTKDDAKKAAGEEALSSLQETCYTIVVKQDVDNDEAEGLTKDEFVSEIKRGGNVIPDNNVGNMLLRKMGWSGGGVGKYGTGIAEPVKADLVIGREGLGLTASKGIDKSFYGKVERTLLDYTRSSDQNDLHFSPEFTKEERAVIHKAAQKYGLKSHSKGKDENRFLIISRKRSAPQLLDHVMNSGGATSKYEVIPPKSQQNEEEYFAHDRQPIWNAVSYGHSKQ